MAETKRYQYNVSSFCTFVSAGLRIPSSRTPAPLLNPVNHESGCLCINYVLTQSAAPRCDAITHQQNRRSAVRRCDCCDDRTAPSTTDIPPLSTARPQYHSSSSQRYRGCFTLVLSCLGFFHWLEFNQEINLLFVEYSHYRRRKRRVLKFLHNMASWITYPLDLHHHRDRLFGTRLVWG